jgi:hypothetical protein
VLPDGRRAFASKTFAVYDWYRGGTESQPDANTIALYRFNGDYINAAADRYHFTASGKVTFADNTTWMRDYLNAGRVVRFRGVGDELITIIAGDPILPNTTPRPTLKISMRIYPRAYPRQPSASIFNLSQGENVIASWAIYNVTFTIPQAPRVQGPSASFDNINVLMTAVDWDRYVTLNTWHEIRIELGTGGRTSLYIDGVLRNNPAVSRVPDYASSSDWALSIGNFDGDIDELRISR